MAKGGQGGKEWGIDAFSSGGRRNSQEDNKMVLDYLKENVQWKGHSCWRKSRALCWDTSAYAAAGWDKDHRWYQEGGCGLSSSLPLTPCLTTGNIALSPPVSHL